MKVTNFKFPVRESWLRENDLRLDSSPYLSGAVEARILLESLPIEKHPLQQLTKGGGAGIFNGPRFRRQYVENQDYGVPFLGSTDILIADLTNLSLLSKQQVREHPELILDEGWTLITCSGTIVRTAYARQEMKGMAGSQHFLRVIPDTDQILPGYLYSYLSSKFGVNLVVAGTYGAIVQHIEPSHIANLPIPRASRELQEVIHNLISEAAELRTEVSKIRTQVLSNIQGILGWKQKRYGFDTTYTFASSLQTRLDAHHFCHAVESGRNILAQQVSSMEIIEFVQGVYEPSRIARKKVDDSRYGIPFFSSSELFRLHPKADYFISKKTQELESFIIDKKDLLLPRSGQIGGIIGRAVLPLDPVVGSAASEHLIRVRCHTFEDAAYLWGILASQPGYYALIGTAYGSSIPSLDRELVKKIKVPWLEHEIRIQIVEQVLLIIQNLNKAIRLESEAVSLVEKFVAEVRESDVG